jgi:hypothetical protein
MSFRQKAFLLLFLSTVTTSIIAEVQSGLGILYQPTPQSCVDFSELRDSCASSTASCACPQPDVGITGMELTSTFGIQADTVLGAAALQLYQQKGVMISNPGVLTQLFDSLLIQRYVFARVNGYAKSVKLGQGVYFIRTSEGDYAALVIFGQYIGGIDRYYYYWAYQNDGLRLLYKGAGPRAKFDSVVVDPHIFSGRMDPVFVIRDSANVAAVRLKVDSLNTLFGTQGGSIAKNYMWWPGIRVTYRQPSYSSYMYFPIETGRDSIACTFTNDAWVLVDKGSRFQRFIVDILIKEDPVSIIGTDTIEAAPLFKMLPYFTGVVPTRNSRYGASGAKEGIRFLPKASAIEVTLASPRNVSVELFDGRGRMTAVLHKGIAQPGLSRISLAGKSAVSGIGFIRVKIDGRTSIARVVDIR